ncbi:MAG: type-F conjugative transfer system pilin assembly protein TrbC [Rickettsiaceae bacterium]|nr:type-F conjugative transfer system pilin assembly protein TrbC [Rickettsiaceae bacterium]
MAQNKLLYVLVLIILYIPASSEAAKENQQIKEDRIFATSLLSKSLDNILENIKSKFFELKAIQGKSNDEEILSNLSIKVFVSSSMSEKLIKDYIAEAKKYKASLIFNGLVDDSWLKTQKFVMNLLEKESQNVSIVINDEDFRDYGVTAVPTIVLTKEDGLDFHGGNSASRKVFDKVTGNVGIRGALSLFSEEGDLAEYAKSFLVDGK